ncbi:lysozyme inhibitor LprI family protein [Antarctobacter heliothermus]|uniref:Uncharacterized conserved protein YecT, DUF1311 family n=1 Tax=Antarctobacter heliothermus TaxID=74033 RepID=A0A239D6E7_9RHOB|nr:lysozyme inhibitor LprI family protein [Antarctobacter heliothermus]SNS27431.1 Uncharacterized conserved protein YecT, DUF1311 family [Antarctobacter heliothermus]
MRTLPILALALALPAGPVASQDLAFSPSATETCLGTGADFRSCVGLSAEACINDSDGGYSTVGMSGCFSREYEWWDDRLNLSYGFAMDFAKQSDVDNAGFGPSQADALRDMQRAWITFRDATCAYERSHWGGGTGAGPAGAECMMRETAEQTWYLESMVTPG